VSATPDGEDDGFMIRLFGAVASYAIAAVQFEVQPEPDSRACHPTDLPYDEEIID